MLLCKYMYEYYLRYEIEVTIYFLHYIPQLKDAAGKYGAVQHCFPVYGGGLEVQGVDGILQVC